MKRSLITLIILLSFALKADAQLFALRNNAVQDVLMTPNIGADLVVGEHSSLHLSVFGNTKPWGKEMKMIGATPELRYWVSGRPLSKFFVGIGALGAAYDVTTDGQVYRGDSFGGGFTFGYDFYLGEHWSLELHGGCAAAYYSHHNYYVGDNYISKKHNAHGYALTPFNVGLSFVYIIK